jgi:hypothetical protein
MGTVYSINSDGTLKKDGGTYSSESERYQIKRDVAEPTPTGPIMYDDVIKTISDMKTSNTPPFLLITYEGLKDKPYVTKDNDLTFLWGDAGTGGWDWGVYRNKNVIVDKNTGASDYICVGDVMCWLDGDAAYITSAYFWSILRQKFLYVHKSICYNCPPRQVMSLKYGDQKLFVADVASGPAEVNYLYYPLGLFGAPKNGQCLGILRAFLLAGPWTSLKIDIYENWGPVRFVNQASKGDHFFVNTATLSSGANLGRSDTNYTLCSPDEALYNLTSCAIGRSTEKNAMFQGLMVPETKTRHEPHARSIMYSFCNTELEVPEFPDICACIGRKGVEDALRVELNNDMVRMVCQSTKCLNGDRTGGVYTFVPSPPCAPINICKPGLDINAARVTMSNVSFNCNFAADSTSTQILSPPPPPTNTTPPPTNTTPPPTNTPPPPANTPPPPANTPPPPANTTPPPPANTTPPPANTTPPPPANTTPPPPANTSSTPPIVVPGTTEDTALPATENTPNTPPATEDTASAATDPPAADPPAAENAEDSKKKTIIIAASVSAVVLIIIVIVAIVIVKKKKKN